MSTADDQEHEVDMKDRLLDLSAYVIDVGSKPIPYIFGGLVAGWLITSLDMFDDDGTAIAMTVLLAVSVSLVFLPPFLWLSRWAKSYRSQPVGEETNDKNDLARWPIAIFIGAPLFYLWVLLLPRIS